MKPRYRLYWRDGKFEIHGVYGNCCRVGDFVIGPMGLIAGYYDSNNKLHFT